MLSHDYLGPLSLQLPHVHQLSSDMSRKYLPRKKLSDLTIHPFHQSPLLAYPNFNRDFTLETDASKLGLGAILSQYQVDQKLHPIAYASRSISNAEANYAVTDLETLAVVWAVTHFRYYLYGHSVTIISDHAAVKAIL